MDQLSSVGSPWAGCAELGGACFAEAEEMLLCVLEAGGRFMARSQRQHSCLGHRGKAAVGPNPRSPGRGGMGPGRQSCSCCVWFPFGPRDLDKRAAFIDWGDWEREGGGSRISLCLFVFLSKHLLSIYCGPGIMVNAFHALSGRIHMTALLLESHSSEEVTKAQKV